MYSQNNKIKDQRYHHQLKCSRVSRDTAHTHTHRSFHHHYIVISSFDGKVTERALYLFPSFFFFCCVVSIDAVEPKGKNQREHLTKKVEKNIFEISAVYVGYCSTHQLISSIVLMFFRQSILLFSFFFKHARRQSETMSNV